ncbi:MAG: hypothetical protein ACOVNL_01350 [Prochlorococcaceae cyanobacterium]|jgi:hypothetical protein
MRPLPPTLLWGSAQAGSSLTLASTAWMVSGLSPSPLVNSLLPALATVPMLLPLRRRAAGYGLQLASVLLLLGVSVAQLSGGVAKGWLLIPSLLAVLLFGIGAELSQLPLQRRLLHRGGLSIEGLRLGSDLGALAGNLLTALLFPAVRQFPPALLLLLPLGSAALPGQQDDSTQPAPPEAPPPLERRCVLQGLLFGGLFALLPLWVRAVGAGNCFDFAMVLAAYGVGRSLQGRLPLLKTWLRYGLMGVLLLLTQITPGWGAVLLFLPLGALAAAADGALVEQVAPLGDTTLGWQVLQRSGAVGGLAGSLGMGLLSQVLGLGVAVPLQVLAFAGMALLAGRPRSAAG